VADSINRRCSIWTFAAAALVAVQSATAGSLLNYVRDYDLNDYSLGVSVATSSSPYAGAPNSVIVYPYLTSFSHSAFTDDWFLIRGENIGFRYITKSDWELGVIGRIQTLGLGGSENDALRGLDERRWTIEAGPLIGWRGSPVHLQFRSYWEALDRHQGTTSELEVSLPWQFDRGYLVPSIKVSYLSDDYSRYYYGVADYEATPSRPTYRPGSAVNTWVGFSLGYQLAPKWLLSSTIGMEYLDSAVSSSPIVDTDKLWSVSIGLAYNADIFEPAEQGAEFRPRFEVRLSALRSSTDTKIIRDSANGVPGEEIDLEGVLGVAGRETVTQFDSFFRMAYYHRWELGYFELIRNSSKQLEQDIDFGDEKFPAGTSVDLDVSSKVLRFAYSYSLMRDEQKELGVTAGLSYSRFKAAVQADETQQFERVEVNSLVPTIGAFGSVTLGDKWQLAVDLNAFSLSFDRFKGYMGFANVNLDRKFGDQFRAGIGYSFYATRLKARDTELRGLYRKRQHGPKLSVSLSF